MGRRHFCVDVELGGSMVIIPIRVISIQFFENCLRCCLNHAFREAIGSRVVGGCEAVINVGQLGDRAEDLVAEFRSIVALTDLWKAYVAKDFE